MYTVLICVRSFVWMILFSFFKLFFWIRALKYPRLEFEDLGFQGYSKKVWLGI